MWGTCTSELSGPQAWYVVCKQLSPYSLGQNGAWYAASSQDHVGVHTRDRDGWGKE